MIFEPLIMALVTAGASFLGAWLAARFALKRFYQEKVWERKTAAYTAIFEALHEMQNRYDAFWEAAMHSAELPEDEQAKLDAASENAYADLRRRLDSEIWLIPQACRERIQQFLYSIRRPAMSDDDLYGGLSEKTGSLISELRDLAQADLGLRERQSILNRFIRR